MNKKRLNLALATILCILLSAAPALAQEGAEAAGQEDQTRGIIMGLALVGTLAILATGFVVSANESAGDSDSAESSS